jgi:hypothetical protein
VSSQEPEEKESRTTEFISNSENLKALVSFPGEKTGIV